MPVTGLIYLYLPFTGYYSLLFKELWKYGILSAKSHLYRAVDGFWPVEELAELAGKPTGCGEVASGGCLFVWNSIVTR